MVFSVQQPPNSDRLSPVRSLAGSGGTPYSLSQITDVQTPDDPVWFLCGSAPTIYSGVAAKHPYLSPIQPVMTLQYRGGSLACQPASSLACPETALEAVAPEFCAAWPPCPPYRSHDCGGFRLRLDQKPMRVDPRRPFHQGPRVPHVPGCVTEYGGPS